MEHDLKGTRCPGCQGVVMKVEELVKAEAPKPGDLVVCQNCGVLGVLSEGMELRRAEREDLEGVPIQILVAIMMARERVWATKRTLNMN